MDGEHESKPLSDEPVVQKSKFGCLLIGVFVIYFLIAGWKIPFLIMHPKLGLITPPFEVVIETDKCVSDFVVSASNYNPGGFMDFWEGGGYRKITHGSSGSPIKFPRGLSYDWKFDGRQYLFVRISHPEYQYLGLEYIPGQSKAVIRNERRLVVQELQVDKNRRILVKMEKVPNPSIAMDRHMRDAYSPPDIDWYFSYFYRRGEAIEKAEKHQNWIGQLEKANMLRGGTRIDLFLKNIQFVNKPLEGYSFINQREGVVTQCSSDAPEAPI